MSSLDQLRQLRDGSRTLRAIHAALRSPYYAARCLLYPRGVGVDLPQRLRVKLHPRFLGIRPDRYEADFSAALDRCIAPGMIVVDVGAHVGLHTLRLSRGVGESGRVIALEPSPANATLLRKHLAWNGCHNVDVIEAAVGHYEGEIMFAFRRDATDPGAFANSIAYDIGGERTQVKVTTLDAICRRFSPSVIKIDIEGAELLAIRGARELLSRSSPVLFVAVHPDAMQNLGTTPEELIELLQGVGYVTRHLDGSPVTKPGFEEIVCEKPVPTALSDAGVPRVFTGDAS